MRKLFIVLFGCVTILLIGYAGYRGYKVWKEHHWMKMAREFLAKSDGRNAMLSLQQVLRSNPMNVEACRMAAKLNEATRSPAALLWWSRVVELNPKSTDDRLALAQTAMLFHDYAAATNSMEGVSVEGRKTAPYQNVAGAVAAAVNRMGEAEAHFMEASRLEPTNQVPQLNLAIVHLHSTNTVALADARAVLERISVDQSAPAMRCQALRELVVDAAHNKQVERALSLSKELVKQTNSMFADRLLRLEVLHGTTNSEFKPSLAAFEREAGDDSSRIYELAMWQMAKTSSGDALAWLRTLPMKTQTNLPSAMLIADCLSQTKNWIGLQKTLTNQNWAELDFIRRAFLVRGLRGQDLNGAAKGEWEIVLRAVNGQKKGDMEKLRMLLTLTARWNWLSESEELLWTIVNQYPSEQWAFTALSQELMAGGRTRPLMMLCSQQAKRTPSDLAVKNNLAMLAFLLDAEELKPEELAREVYEKAPTNAAYLSTYAFSLYHQKKSADALRTMEKLSAKQLQDPGIAGYYGIILKASGNPSKAKPYLEAALKTRLLPEERKMMEGARL